MLGTCSVCQQRLNSGTRIYQFAVGRYYRGFQTPTYENSSAVISECHEECFSEPSLTPQPGPYDCSLCSQAIGNGTRVLYLVQGDKPAPGYKRPERRGHEMPFIAHEACCEAQFEIAESTKSKTATFLG